MTDLMEKIVSLCKRRGFIFAGSEIYGGLANSWDFGPLGVELKNNIKKLWWEKFIHRRDDVVGLDSTIIMNSKVWEASGHLTAGFADELVECKKCNRRFRYDQLKELSVAEVEKELENECTIDVPSVMKSQGKEFQKQWRKCECGEIIKEKPRKFNLMLRTNLGPVEGNTVYFRPETAQGMFVDFKNVSDTTRKTLPFGIAQVGKVFRNEITTGNFIFRLREFEMMEIEYFVREKDWQKYFEYWRKEVLDWIKEIGIDVKKIHEAEIPERERAHYSKRTIDFEYSFPFGRKELYGLAYRADFDLKNHEKFSGKNLKYKDPETGEEFWPHIIEPTWGVERSVLAVLCESYHEDKERVVLRLKPKLAPYKAAVFPLLANKPRLIDFARKIYENLRQEIFVAWDDRGNIGKRYYSQDEIGTPFCITIDFESLEKDDVTIRDRDTMKQERVKIQDLIGILKERL